MNLIIEAARFAIRCHAAQKRKYSNAPYIVHPMRVAGAASLLPFAEEELVAAAWLHDVAEDCGVTIEQLENEFGIVVPCFVEWLTNPSKGVKAPRAERKRMDREHIAAAPLPVRALKALDSIDNLREMHDAPDDFRRLYLKESEALLECLNLGSTPSIYGMTLADELRHAMLGLLTARLGV